MTTTVCNVSSELPRFKFHIYLPHDKPWVKRSKISAFQETSNSSYLIYCKRMIEPSFYVLHD
ncbi:MAG: type II toxin-antitoxin system YafO family toxin [Anaerolineales bacterium]|nr:type II toxin-antitoxin system YafO family toxin [Anaerolineales bacterium]